MNTFKNTTRYNPRRKMASGGNYFGTTGTGSISLGSTITRANANYSDKFIKALNKEQNTKAAVTAISGAGGGALSGLSLGATIGAGGGPIGAAIGAAIGLIGGGIAGIFTAKKNKRLAKEVEASNLEMQRQNDLSSMMNKSYNDIEFLRNQDASQMAGVGFYAKAGGRIPMRKKYYNGGIRYYIGANTTAQDRRDIQSGEASYERYAIGNSKFKNTGTSVNDTKSALNTLNGAYNNLRINGRNIKLNGKKISEDAFSMANISGYTIDQMEAMKTLLGDNYDDTSMFKAQMEAMYDSMDDRERSDVEYFRNAEINRNQNIDFYGRMGGRYKGRIRKASGGLVPNSKNTQVAYGATHEQYNEDYGMTGIPLGGDAEVEGGGDINGNLKAGEVIKYDTNGDALVYSDTLKPRGSKKTYAKLAKNITDRKGSLEEINNGFLYGIEEGLNKIVTNPANRLSRGTRIRNIEKAGIAMNMTSGMIQAQDSELDNLYLDQEEQAYQKGLRQEEQQMRCGGRKKMLTGGMIGIMGGASALNFLGNIGNYISNKHAIEREAAMTVPEISTTEAARYRSRYNITPQLQALDSDIRSAEDFIRSNTANPQIARAQIASLSSRAAAVRGQIYNQKNEIEGQLQDRNIESRYNNYLRNTQIRDQNRLNQYNKNIDINSKRAAVTGQLYQGLMNTVGDALDIATQVYGIDMYSQTHASDAITKDLGWGKRSLGKSGSKRDIGAAYIDRENYIKKYPNAVADIKSSIDYNPYNSIIDKLLKKRG